MRYCRTAEPAEPATHAVEITKGRNPPLALLLEFVRNFSFSMNDLKNGDKEENEDTNNKPSRPNAAHRCPHPDHPPSAQREVTFMDPLQTSFVFLFSL